MSSNQYSHISDAARKTIDSAVLSGPYRLERDSSNHPFIDLFIDLNEPNDYLLQTAYDHRLEPKEKLLAALHSEIMTEYKDDIIRVEDDILSAAGFNPYAPMTKDPAALRAYLRSAYPIYPPYEEFLCQPICVNILLATPEERTQYYSLIKTQYRAMLEPDKLTSLYPQTAQDILDKDSILKRLVEEQGYTMDDLATTLRDFHFDFRSSAGIPAQYLDAQGNQLPDAACYTLFSAGRSTFLTSLCVELSNHYYTKGCITVLTEMSMSDFIKMMEPHAEITMPANCQLGIFSPWGGHTSALGIRLSEKLTFRRKDIWDVQIEGAIPEFGHTIDSVHSAEHHCRRSPLSITSQEPTRKPSLDSRIATARQRSIAGPAVDRSIASMSH